MKQRMFAAMAAASKRVSFLVVLMVAVVFNFMLVSCDPAEQELRTMSDTYEVKKPHTPDDPDEPELNFGFNYGVNNHTTSVETPWTLTENTNNISVKGTCLVWVSHKEDRFAVPDIYREISLTFAQEHTTQSQVYSKLISATPNEKVYEDSICWTSVQQDGNLCYNHAKWERREIFINGSWYKLPYIRVTNAKVKALHNLPGNTDMTRGTFVSDSIVRKGIWEDLYEVVRGDVPETAFHQAMEFTEDLEDMYKVLLLSEDDIERAYLKSQERIVLDNKREDCRFTEVLVMKSGEEHEYTHNYILNRLVKGIDEYTKDVTSFNYNWRYDNSISLGNVSKGIRKENNWTVDSRTDSFGALISNGAEPVTTSYTYYHEGCTYKDEWIEVEFPLITPVMKEKETHVESIVSDDANYEQARLFNNIDTEYLTWQQVANESVKLQMPKAAPDIEVVSEGWDFDRYTEIIYNDSIVHLPIYVIVYSDGNRVTTKFHFVADRGLENYNTFDVIEDNESERTGNVNVVLSASREMSGEDKGATAVWKRNTYELSNGVQLNASRQENHWRSVESEDFECTYRGRTFTAPKHNISTSNVSNVAGGNVVGQYKVFNYTDDLTYNYGDNSKNSVAKGTIRVPAVTVVSEGWDASSAKEVWSDSKVTWSIDWVVKFSDGTEDRTSFAAEAPRLFTVDPAWISIEDNANYSTGNYVVTVENSENQSKTVNGATFNWTRETRSIKTNVQLAASTQVNTWHATDPFGCKVTYKGKTYDFGRKNMSLSHQDHLTGGTESNGFKVYNYGDDMSYTVADNTKSLTAEGTIKVKVEDEIPTFFPKDWGELLEIKQTVANNKTHDGYVYTWSLRFKNNIVLPVVVERGSTNPSWNFGYAEYTLVTAYNGGTFEAATGSWVNTIAADETNHMVWSREGGERANKNYKEAKAENWDEGHLIGNRPSTQTSRYQFSIVDGVLSATDTYTGKFMGSWSSYVAK